MIIENILNKIKAIGKTSNFQIDDSILTEGTEGNTIFFLLKGEVGVTLFTELGKEILLNKLKAPNFFGEIGMLDNRERSATIVALTECEVVEINREKFLEFIKQENETFFIFMLEMIRRLREANRKIYILSINNASERLKCYIRDLFLNSLNKQPPKLNLPFHSDLSKEIGLARETITKILGEFKKEGVISDTNGEIKVNEKLLFK